MKIKASLVLCILFFRPFAVCPWDLILSSGVDYASYSPYSEGNVGNVFAPDLLPIYDVKFKGEFAVEYNYSFRVLYDPIWREMFFGDVGYHFGNVDMGLGFFVSDFDTTVMTHSVGFSGHVGFEFPGIFLVNVGAASSLDDGSWPPGASKRRRFSGRVGFWLPHIFITFDYETKEFTKHITDTLDTRIDSTLYKGYVEIYSKNIPYRIRLGGGIRELWREVTTNNVVTESVSVASYFVGLGFYARPLKIFSWFIEGEVFFSDVGDFDDTINFSAMAGFVFSYPES
jgi:hypothetical protein